MQGLNNKDLELLQQIRTYKDTQKLSPQENDKWEMDVDVILDNLYHGWLGEKLINAQWERDDNLYREMNQMGASLLINDIKPRFNINSQFSVLPHDKIKEIASETSEDIMKILKYDYWKYEINPNHITRICRQILDALYIWLMISYNGGMRDYKGNKTKTIISKQEQPVGVY